MELGKMISKLRNERGLNQRDFAKFLGVSNGAVGMWETGKRQPDLETIKKIASFFDVTVDYLIGNPKGSIDYANNPTSIVCYEIASRIKNIASTSNKNLNELLPLLKTKILDGECYNINDFIHDIYTISDFFGVSDEYILGGKELEDRTYYSLNDEEKKFLLTFQQLDQDNKDIILGDMKKYIKQQRQEPVAADEALKKTGTENMGK